MLRKFIKDGPYLKLSLTAQSQDEAQVIESFMPSGKLPATLKLVAKRTSDMEVVIGLEPVATSSAAIDAQAAPVDGLEAKTVADLKTQAAELNIEIKPTDVKAVIIGKIREKLAVKAS